MGRAGVLHVSLTLLKRKNRFKKNIGHQWSIENFKWKEFPIIKAKDDVGVAQEETNRDASQSMIDVKK